MEKNVNKKLTISIIAVIIIIAGLITLKIFNSSYALPVLETPVIDDVVKTTDDPLQVQIKYTLTNVQDEYYVEIINNTDTKIYKDNVSKYEGANEFYINDLEKGKTYEFTIKMCSDTSNCVESLSKIIEIEPEAQDQNQNTDSNTESENIVPVAPVVPLGKVTYINATSITSSSISVRWNSANSATGYIMRYKLASTSGWREHKISGTSVNIKSLKANTWYDIAVRPVKNSEMGPWYQKRFLTNPYVPNIKGFKAKKLSSSKVKLSWKRNNNKNVVYELYRSTDGKRFTRIKKFGYRTTTYTNKKLSANKTYYYKMRISNSKIRKGKTFYGNYTATKKISTPVANKNTYIVVSIKDQKIWFYKNGKLILKSNVVTGKNGKNRTPKGTYKVRSKSRSTYLIGRDYVSFVNYWMLIDRRTQIGIHDATWRSKFGGNIYKRNGSHGCVNLPLKTAKTIYSKAPVGTKVIIK